MTTLQTLKVGRNNLCPCGSGKKYKKCCLSQSVVPNDDSEEKKSQEALLQKVVRRHPDYKILISQEPQDLKVSEIILEYADEFLTMARTDHEKKSAIIFAIVAWNLALMNEDNYEDVIDGVLANTLEIKKGSKNWRGMKSILAGLIHKKQTEYPSINRYILDYEIITLKNGSLHLNVVSGMRRSKGQTLIFDQ